MDIDHAIMFSMRGSHSIGRRFSTLSPADNHGDVHGAILGEARGSGSVAETRLNRIAPSNELRSNNSRDSLSVDGTAAPKECTQCSSCSHFRFAVPTARSNLQYV